MDSLSASFPSFEECLTKTQEPRFGIVDGASGEKASLIFTQDNDWDFEVNNYKDLILTFLAIDDCLFSSLDQERCDCAVFSEKIILFLELKDVKKKQRNRARRKAIKQLENTLSTFQSSLSTLEVFAVIGFKSAKKNPIANTNRQAAIAHFTDLYNAKLQEGNSFEFAH